MRLFKRKKKAISLGPLFKYNRNEKLSRFINKEKARIDPSYFINSQMIINMLLYIDIETVPIEYLEEIMGTKKPETDPERFTWLLDAELKLRVRASHEILLEYLL